MFNIMSECDPATFTEVFDSTWKADGYNTTKENFSALRVEHLLPRFRMVCLIRNMAHTFPTSAPNLLCRSIIVS